jgi:hypothetical protein
LKALNLTGAEMTRRFPIQCGMLSQRLEDLGIEHFAKEYVENHMNKIWTTDGRVSNDRLPFFNEYLNLGKDVITN